MKNIKESNNRFTHEHPPCGAQIDFGKAHFIKMVLYMMVITLIYPTPMAIHNSLKVKIKNAYWKV